MNDARTRVDEAIDRAVRDLMRRDAPAAFRTRVLARLEAPQRRVGAWPAFAATVGVLAVSAIGIVVLHELGTDAPRNAVPMTASQPAPPGPMTDAPPPPAAPAPAPASPVRRVPRAEPVRTATFGPRDGRVAAASMASPRRDPAEPGPAPAVVLESLADTLPPTIEIRPLAPPAPIEIAPIVVPPLRIPRMTQAPASPPR